MGWQGRRHTRPIRRNPRPLNTIATLKLARKDKPYDLDLKRKCCTWFLVLHIYTLLRLSTTKMKTTASSQARTTSHCCWGGKDNTKPGETATGLGQVHRGHPSLSMYPDMRYLPKTIIRIPHTDTLHTMYQCTLRVLPGFADIKVSLHHQLRFSMSQVTASGVRCQPTVATRS